MRARGWKDRLSVDCRTPVSQTQCLVASRVHLCFINASTMRWELAGTCCFSCRDLHYPSPLLPAFASPSCSHEHEIKNRTLGGPHRTLGTLVLVILQEFTIMI